MLVDMGFTFTGLTGVVTLTNATQSVSEPTPVGDMVVGTEVRYPDGTLYTFYDDTGVPGPNYTQKNASTDWIIPNSAATDKTYHTKLTKTGGTATLDTGSGGSPENTWVELTDTVLFMIQRSTTGTYIGTLSISDDIGVTTLDSCTITIEIII